jgi:hypothetical protein
LLIGAGIAYAIYERRRSGGEYYESEMEDDFARGGYEEDAGQATMEGEDGGAVEGMKEKASEAKEKISAGMESAKEKARQLRGQVADAGHAMREKAGQWKEGAQRKFGETSEAHPLPMGLGFLALGILAGLAVSGTRKEDEWLGSMSQSAKERAKSKGREMVERGRHVASAAVSAAKQEAAEQGLTPETLKEKARQVAVEAKGAAQSAAEREGFKSPQPQGQAQPAGATPAPDNPPPYQG